MPPPTFAAPVETLNCQPPQFDSVEGAVALMRGLPSFFLSHAVSLILPQAGEPMWSAHTHGKAEVGGISASAVPWRLSARRPSVVTTAALPTVWIFILLRVSFVVWQRKGMYAAP